MSETVQFVHVEGEENVSVAVAGDVVQGDKIVQQYLGSGAEFYRPDLEKVKPPLFESPPIAEPLVSVLLAKRMLVLGGTGLREKAELSRHLAWLLQERLANRLEADAGDQVTILEAPWGTARPQLEARFAGETEPTIFLLRDADPFRFDHNLERLRQLIQASPHYLLITTNSARSSWGLEAAHAARDLWCELGSRDVYSSEYLAHLLRSRLLAARELLPAALFPRGLDAASKGGIEQPLIGDLTLAEAVETLTGRGPVLSLCSWVLSSRRPLTERHVRRQIQLLKGDGAALHSWYLQLEPRHRLLVTGVLLFERLLDDQLFAALDLAVERVWRPRQPGLESFDYQDFDLLDAYVTTSAAEGGGVQFELTPAEAYQGLLAVVWRLHRRHLLATLPQISELVREAGRRSWRWRQKRGHGAATARTFSLEPPSLKDERGSQSSVPGTKDLLPDFDDEEEQGESPARIVPLSRWERSGPLRELIGSAPRRERFCAVVARSLGQIGLVSPDAIERCLFELAAHGSWEAQSVAALALVALRGTPREGRLFSSLSAWYHDARRRAEALGSASQPSKVASEHAYVRATVALAVYYGALADRSGELAEGYIRLLSELAADMTPVVRERLRRQTLPALVLGHQRQLDPVLRNLVRYSDLIEPVAASWASAHPLRPEETAELLEAWMSESLGGQPAAPPSVSIREAQLATVALTYGYIDYRDPGCRLTVAQAVIHLKALLREPHPFLRKRVFRAIGLLISRWFQELEGSFQSLVESIPISDRGEIIRPLASLYVEQRSQLSGGEGMVVAGARAVPVWLSSARPLTPVETALERWLLDEGEPVAQQISFETLSTFLGGPLGQAEAQWQWQTWGREHGGAGAAPQTPSQAAAIPPTPLPRHPLRESTAVPRLFLALATLGAPEERGTLLPLTAEVVQDLEEDRSLVTRLLAGWSRRQGKLGTAGKALARFARWYQNRVLFLLAALAVGAISLVVLTLLSVGW